ncbi:GNAT family N-acetyltransferase [Corynebacterium kutscheri]|nr:GNAT family N-acetyltransferase [Corynebacterium kutscheri]
MSMSEITLIPTTESDRSYIARLNFLTEVFGDEHAELTDQEMKRFHEDFEYYVRQWEPNNGGFIAWDGDIPAGGVWLVWGTDQQHGYGYVDSRLPELAIAVEPRYRKGKGVGTALIQEVLELAQKQQWAGVSLSVSEDNPRAHALYRRLGFKDVRYDAPTKHYVLEQRFPA